MRKNKDPNQGCVSGRPRQALASGVAGQSLLWSGSEEFETDPEHLFNMAHGIGHCKNHHAVLRLDHHITRWAHHYTIAVDRTDADTDRQIKIAKRHTHQR